MSLFKVFGVSGSAIAAQNVRLNVIASNLANADSIAGPDGKAYKARQVVFQTQLADFNDQASAGVRVAGVNESEAEGRKIYDPKNPLADESGNITMPNVNVIDEMVNMIEASRAYQNNIEVMNTTKSLLAKTIAMGS
ncbi:MAG: flagellar basal body rod protein FlgC [Rhodocyclaceae bacterium]|jgi:flagellar basal-body rod protein FlgC|nr:flagellar basal body rod protein FlgC [Rhodocyclaceae bacterium]MCA3003420.1 flagellar basal body rod protein FlgC [Rhodocyclaceae bacterium]MCA3019929.1 flagellar basal body rod protein FlgC [Rhodocyclaceae bacterium]MCA3021781.1 flagellar basal body rod protein FlgC [Rhodocyclaceae bacterium]MCA3026714.1 flagellar basal body rod protein FlgC [Rhodocyclaceae bacterium]